MKLIQSHLTCHDFQFKFDEMEIQGIAYAPNACSLNIEIDPEGYVILSFEELGQLIEGLSDSYERMKNERSKFSIFKKEGGQNV